MKDGDGFCTRRRFRSITSLVGATKTKMKTVLITGAAGNIGSQLRQQFAAKYKLRLSDKRLLRPRADEAFVQADIVDLSAALAISEGIDAIVHLGGYAGEGLWETILQANIIGCYNVFEAARRNGVKRLVFASSNHALGFYRCDQRVDHRVYPKPDTRYGVSKAFGEMLGSLYADKYGLQVFLIRIGYASSAPGDLHGLALWISPRDLAQLVAIGIDHPDIRFEIVYGVSRNTRSWYDNSNAERLGYLPQDNSEFMRQRCARERALALRSPTSTKAGPLCTLSLARAERTAHLRAPTIFGKIGDETSSAPIRWDAIVFVRLGLPITIFHQVVAKLGSLA